MNLTEDKKEPLRSRTKEQKRIMVEMQYKGAAQPKGKTDSPQVLIKPALSFELLVLFLFCENCRSTMS